MEFKTRISAELEIDGYAFTFSIPAGASFKASHQAALEFAQGIDSWAKTVAEQEKAKQDQAKAEEYNALLEKEKSAKGE